MSVGKYWVRGTSCLSCGIKVQGPAVVVVTKVKEDYEVQAYIVVKLDDECGVNDRYTHSSYAVD